MLSYETRAIVANSDIRNDGTWAYTESICEHIAVCTS
jgi:hypothetical protein